MAVCGDNTTLSTETATVAQIAAPAEAARQTEAAPTPTTMPTQPDPTVVPTEVEKIRFQSGDFTLGEDLQPNQGCSVIYATDGELMLGGNNEDYFNPLTKVWFIPGEAGSFGRVYFGFDDYHAQGGMNEQGLFFDGLGLATTLEVAREGKEQHSGNLVDKAMSECATVECVVGLFEQYYTHHSWHWQFLFGDATGESAIIEPQVIIRQQGSYQVATNFYQSTTPPEQSNCWRYQRAVEELEHMEELSAESMRDVLDAVHQDGPAHTLYSNVYDLKNQIVYLYYFHNYDEVVVLDLEEELQQGYHAYDLPSLFPPNQAAESWAGPKLRRYNELIESRLATDLDSGILQAYAGEYEMPEGWGPPDQPLIVIAQERALLLRFPDYRQHELLPESATDFFHVTFQESDFVVAYEARFGLDEERRVEYLEFVFGSESIRIDRLGPESVLPEAATPEPMATLEPTSTATAQPVDTPAPTTLPAPTATPVELALAEPTATVAEETIPATKPETSAGFPWAWLIAALLIVGAAAGWLAIRRGITSRPTKE
jgi:hypothetical protein